MASGIHYLGDTAVKRTEKDHNMEGFDAAVLWGYTEPCQRIVKSCVAANIPWVFMDNGYMLRNTHFKVSVNDRHPTAFMTRLQQPGDRFAQWNHPLKPWVPTPPVGAPIILAGMSPKAAWSWGLGFEEWERETFRELRKHTTRPVIYRPKSNSPMARPIDGTTMDRDTPVWKLLCGVHAVVTHHSNIGCDALYEGVPVFTKYGAALPLATHVDQLHLIERPLYPEGREQWVHNLAYFNWSASEMRFGECWNFMKRLF